MSDIEFAFAVILYIMLVPYVIDPPTPYERTRQMIIEFITRK
jgi:hypothetical protein